MAVLIQTFKDSLHRPLVWYQNHDSTRIEVDWINKFLIRERLHLHLFQSSNAYFISNLHCEFVNDRVQ